MTIEIGKVKSFFKGRTLLWWLAVGSIIYVAFGLIFNREATIKGITEGLDRASRQPIVIQR